MPDSSNTAGPQKPRRRWFQFRLRTMLIGVMLLTIPLSYVAHQYGIVLERKAVLRSLRQYHADAFAFADDFFGDRPVPQLPFVRRWFGDRPYSCIRFPRDVAPDVGAKIMAAFPEAEADDYDMLPLHQRAR